MRSRPTLVPPLAGLLTALLLVLSGCSTATTDGGQQDLVTEHGLDGLEARDVIDRLEATPVSERPPGLIASVQPESVLMTDVEGREERLPLPDDAFYLSVAPYLEQTHECHFHSLTTCRGELGNEDITVRVVSDKDGAVVLDQTVRTQDNGFAGLWLPADMEATLTVEHEGRRASTPITTGADAPTCLTTLQLR
ncbi:CueP family metal-binding protein [Ornithinimicrobium sufpigmenti]|uniref:CueP family metal-binding protein n=1 Tax=Ornithinimicrobium sufpigmenti TaxID=2508882 RepID=UPI0010357346|nr:MULTISPECIES: CueP family metal-binding protein [unclassified Ornithinimicrobium]